MIFKDYATPYEVKELLAFSQNLGKPREDDFQQELFDIADCMDEKDRLSFWQKTRELINRYEAHAFERIFPKNDWFLDMASLAFDCTKHKVQMHIHLNYAFQQCNQLEKKEEEWAYLPRQLEVVFTQVETQDTLVHQFIQIAFNQFVVPSESSPTNILCDKRRRHMPKRFGEYADMSVREEQPRKQNHLSSIEDSTNEQNMSNSSRVYSSINDILCIKYFAAPEAREALQQFIDSFQDKRTTESFLKSLVTVLDGISKNDYCSFWSLISMTMESYREGSFAAVFPNTAWIIKVYALMRAQHHVSDKLDDSFNRIFHSTSDFERDVACWSGLDKVLANICESFRIKNDDIFTFVKTRFSDFSVKSEFTTTNITSSAIRRTRNQKAPSFMDNYATLYNNKKRKRQSKTYVSNASEDHSAVSMLLGLSSLAPQGGAKNQDTTITVKIPEMSKPKIIDLTGGSSSDDDTSCDSEVVIIRQICP